MSPACLAIFGFSAWCLFGPSQEDARALQSEPERDEKVRWLEDHAFAIDPESGEFTDAGPVLEMFDGVEVVLLGEASHGDGTAFEAKTQMVRFLHQELGFDVLMFESGMFDCARAWQRIQSGEKTAEVVKDALFDLWSASRQVQSLFEYLDEQKGGEHPLELAGFDLQFSGSSASAQPLLEDIDARLKDLGLSEAKEWNEARAALREIVSGDRAWDARSAEDQKLIGASIEKLAEICASAGRGKQQQCIDQVIQYLPVMLKLMNAIDTGSRDPALLNLRDEQMAKNLLWARENLYAGRKIIGWGHTGHFLRDRGASPRSTALSMGEPLSPVLKDKLLVIAATTFEGTSGLTRRGTRPADRIGPAPENSLEGMFKDAGFQRCLLDLRPKSDSPPWPSAPQTARLVGHSATRAPWPRAVDAILYLAEMRASEPLN